MPGYYRCERSSNDMSFLHLVPKVAIKHCFCMDVNKIIIIIIIGIYNWWVIMNVWINDMDDKWDLNDEFIPIAFLQLLETVY